jgi:hypothetical protein
MSDVTKTVVFGMWFAVVAAVFGLSAWLFVEGHPIAGSGFFIAGFLLAQAKVTVT